MRWSRRPWLLVILGFLCACGGGGSNGTTTIVPPANPTGNVPSSNTESVQLGSQPTSATLPVISQINGKLFFPPVNTPTLISLSASATAPAGVALDSRKRPQGGTLTVYEYFTITSPITVSLPSIPAIVLNFPVTTPLTGKSVYYGISDLNAQGGLVSFNTRGPGTISGDTCSFAQVPTSITFVAGHKYTFIVYATTVVKEIGASKIYVTAIGFFAGRTGYIPSTVTTYIASSGSRTTPTITAGLSSEPLGVAVDASGKIYVVCTGDGLTTYRADGAQTTPTITGLHTPYGVAVDAAGKIYVVNESNNTVTAYNPDGTQTTPTITAGLDVPVAIAVDVNGKIYVANYGYGSGTVTTYNANGTQTTPTILGVDGSSLAVDTAGKIYVANYGSGRPNTGTVTTYTANGTPTTPTIIGFYNPSGVAVDRAGNIYVVDGSYVTTYNANGARINPTLTVDVSVGLGTAAAVAVH